MGPPTAWKKLKERKSMPEHGKNAGNQRKSKNELQNLVQSMKKGKRHERAKKIND